MNLACCSKVGRWGSFLSRCGSVKPRKNGFSLSELLITVVILGVLAAVAVPGFLFVLRRERINAVALELAGWLEEVRNLSARRVNNDPSVGGCAISLSLTSGMGANAVLATAEQACGARSPQLRIPSDFQGTLTAESSNGNSIIFTPRGLWIAEPSVSGPLEIRLLLDGGGPLRCVRLSETLGSVDIGRSGSNDLEAGCDDFVAI